MKTAVRSRGSGLVLALRCLLLLGGAVLPVGFVSFQLAGGVSGTLAVSAQERIGIANYHLSSFLFAQLGLSAWLLPVLAAIWGFRLPRRLAGRLRVTVALVLACMLLAVLLHTSGLGEETTRFAVGGTVAAWLAHLAVKYFNPWGGTILVAGLLVVVLASLTASPRLGNPLRAAGERSWAVIRELKPRIRFRRAPRESLESALGRGRPTRRKRIALSEDSRAGRAPEKGGRRRRQSVEAPGVRGAEVGETTSRPAIVREEAGKVAPAGERKERAATKVAEERAVGVSGEEGISYRLPLLSLLRGTRGEEDEHISQDELLSNSELVEEKLAHFGVKAKVVEVHPGPVITLYELEPDPGVKIQRIANLADDLALALKAQSTRIVAPLPGKGTIGVEIPNRKAQTVGLREILDSDAFRNLDTLLPIAIGKDTAGRPFCASLEEMPHLLIAGATGSGKSVCIHSLVCSLLFRATPEQVKLALIDPKMLELTSYNGVPHLVSPVVTDAKKAVLMLHWVVREMDSRYRRLARAGVRSITDFNALGQRPAQEEEEGEKGAYPLPYIVVIIDELADLMLTVPQEIEELIARLAQMARAVGIHLVVATQRPSVDVITGVIKANFPSRIAFKVPSKTDSRTILDANGAEKLLGRGDMLFLAAGRAEPVRLHGAFVSGAEAKSVAKYIVGQATETQEIDLKDVVESSEGDGLVPGDDELFETAARLVVTHQQGSISLIQRRLKVGYARAARLMDILEGAGIVGPFEGSKSRQVLVSDEEGLARVLAERKV